MKVDIVILSNAKNDHLKSLTQQAIDTCVASETTIEFNIIVIEQSNVTYTGATVHYDNSEFNYNRFMNKGIALGSAQYVCICNNDLIFFKEWASVLITAMQKHDLLSACPICPNVQPLRLPLTEEVYFGYRNSHEVSGWCIMMNRAILDIIGKLDEEFEFWFADNVYSEQLKKHGIQHAVVSNSVVEHLGSRTLNTLDKRDKNKFTSGLVDKFLKAYPDNESSKFFRKFRR